MYSITRIKQEVKWRDLLHLTPREKWIENLLCWPWLILSLTLAYHQWYALALLISGGYFLTALRQSHNGYHNALGISQQSVSWTLLTNSVFMLASLHSVKLNHMEHHKHDLDKEDYERTVADMPWWRALIQGPNHWWHNHIEGCRLATPKEKKWIRAELVLIGLLVLIAIVFQVHFLIYHILFMILAEMLMPFFTIWITHHGHDENTIAHVRRNKWLNRLTLNMLLHYEHHLFPAVPTIKLGELTRRIEEFENFQIRIDSSTSLSARN